MSYRNERAEKIAAEIFGEENAHLKEICDTLVNWYADLLSGRY